MNVKINVAVIEINRMKHRIFLDKLSWEGYNYLQQN